MGAVIVALGVAALVVAFGAAQELPDLRFRAIELRERSLI